MNKQDELEQLKKEMQLIEWDRKHSGSTIKNHIYEKLKERYEKLSEIQWNLTQSILSLLQISRKCSDAEVVAKNLLLVKETIVMIAGKKWKKCMIKKINHNYNPYGQETFLC